MKAKFRRTLERISALLRQGGKDLGTVSLGASAILLSRAFPPFACGECDDLDFTMLIASGSFFAVGLALRYLSQADDA